jgi:transmembrane sensor
MPDHRETDDVMAREAIAWYVRLKDTTATDADRDAFHAWVTADPARGRAYEDAMRLWGQLYAPAVELGAGGWYQPVRHRAFAPPALATLALVVLVVVAVWWRDPGIVDRAFADHATTPGARQDVILADGTRAYLDADSAITVSITQAVRDVHLRRGRVWFEVASDQGSSFRVVAGDVEARVLGTSFAIEWQPDAVVVTVERGRVSVACTGKDPALVLTARQRLRIAAGASATPEPIDPDIVLAWRRGLIVFDRASLGTVIDELDRMTPGRVLVMDENLRQLTLSGVFRAEDPAAVLGALRSAFGAKTTTIPRFATLIHR